MPTITEIDTGFQKFEFHYFFGDETHSIDAAVRHKCETEILSLINQVAQELKIEIKIDIEPALEGGFIDKYKVDALKVAVYSAGVSTIGLVFIILNTVLSRHPVSTVNPELEKLNIEVAKKTIEKLNREAEADANTKAYLDTINYLRNKVAGLGEKEKPKLLGKGTDEEKKEEKNEVEKPAEETWMIEKDSFSSQKLISQILYPELPKLPTEIELGGILTKLETSYKIIRHKSNLFSSLEKYSKVTKITATPLNGKNKQAEEPLTILREQFSSFIVESDELPSEIDEYALIEIISPVLKKGKYKWKGLYKGQPIDFFMRDSTFKESVIRKEVSFTNGITIECFLEIKKRIDELGNIQITNYSVTTVTGYTEEGIKTETEKGRSLRNKRKADEDQMDIEFPNPE